jgi:hypothetical protein
MVIDTENMRTSGRHGQKLHELGFGTLDAQGNWQPFEPVPLTQVNWPAVAVLAGLVAFWGLIAWAVVEWVGRVQG